MDMIKIKTRLTSKSNFNFNNEKKEKNAIDEIYALLEKHQLIACASPTRI